MRTFSLLKGLPIYEKNKGHKLGEVYDLSISNNGTVKGLLLRKRSLINKTFFIPIEHISSFGRNGVMVDDGEVLKHLNQSAQYTFESQHKLTGRMLMSSEGEKLGYLEDVYFHEELGTIVGYECSDGFFSDISEGKRVIKTDAPPVIGKDAIIVDIK